MAVQQIYNKILAQKLIEEFARRNMEGFFCETGEQALAQALALLPREALISCGGSATLEEIGLLDALRQGGYNFLDPHSGHSSAEMDAIAHGALAADYYFMSANAIAETGELVNVDGYGNRVAALIFGPKHIIIIAGLNKVTPTLAEALQRAKTYAARMITLKFTADHASFTELQQAAENAVSQLLITSKFTDKERVKIILVGEALGF